jgi:hypothetical protein
VDDPHLEKPRLGRRVDIGVDDRLDVPRAECVKVDLCFNRHTNRSIQLFLSAFRLCLPPSAFAFYLLPFAF